jgi:hypothetical protein
MYDAATNQSYSEMVGILNATGPESVLIAYHGFKLVNYLSNNKREVSSRRIFSSL